jgi:hypothetical protein
MTNNLAVKWGEPAPRFSYPEEEQAVVGYLAMRGFEGIPRAAVIEPEAFASTVGGVFYAAAYALHRAGREVGHQSLLDAVERNRHWLRQAETGAKEEGSEDWRNYLLTADRTLGYNRGGGKLVAEMLKDIAAAAEKRQAVSVGQALVDGSMAPDEAARALHASRASRAQGVERHSIKALFQFQPKEDPSTLLGNRWVCKGGQLLLVGQSGVGKSSLTVQAAMTWALGLPFFGITPARPLKSLYIQAENDEGDMAEIVQGVMSHVVAKSGMPQDEALRLLNDNLEFVRVTAAAGEEFGAVVRDLVRERSVDLVFGDPLLSFVGDDISQQSVASRFLRGVLNPLAFEFGFAWVWSHHTGKPQSDSKSRAHWNANDYAYIGLGSSELTNWARAIAVLQTTKEEGTFKLLLAKRGTRAGVEDEHRLPVTSLVLKHAETGLHWEVGKLEEDSEQQETSKGHAGRKPTLLAADIIHLKAEHAKHTGPMGAFISAAMKKYKASRSKIYAAIRSN